MVLASSAVPCCWYRAVLCVLGRGRAKSSEFVIAGRQDPACGRLLCSYADRSGRISPMDVLVARGRSIFAWRGYRTCSALGRPSGLTRGSFGGSGRYCRGGPALLDQGAPEQNSTRAPDRLRRQRTMPLAFLPPTGEGLVAGDVYGWKNWMKIKAAPNTRSAGVRAG